MAIFCSINNNIVTLNNNIVTLAYIIFAAMTYIA